MTEAGDDHARVERLERRLDRERTAREQAERIAERGMRDLWETNRGLEERVAERTRELNRSLAAATMAAEAKERFLAELGHELTTPLHAVVGLVELIDAEPLSSEDRARLVEARSNAVRLAELLRGLVDLAGAEGASGSADVTAVSPATWLDALVEQWTRPAARRGQLLVPETDATSGEVHADWTRLTRVADAALANVVDHATAGSVDVSVRVDADGVELTVSDGGPGMSQEQVATAAEPFVKHAESGGVGIGLAIAARLAASGGGRLEIEPTATGTLIRAVLPRSDRTVSR